MIFWAPPHDMRTELFVGTVSTLYIVETLVFNDATTISGARDARFILSKFT